MGSTGEIARGDRVGIIQPGSAQRYPGCRHAISCRRHRRPARLQGGQCSPPQVGNTESVPAEKAPARIHRSHILSNPLKSSQIAL